MRPVPSRWVDLALVGGLGALATVELVSAPPSAPGVTAAFTGLAVAALLLRRTAPLMCAAGMTVALTPLALMGGGTPPFATFVAAVVAMYSQTRFGGSRWRVAAGAGLLVGAVVVVTVIEFGRGGTPFDLVYPLVYFGGAAAVGYGVRRLAELTGRLAEQAAELERSRERDARLAVADERTRIARDLHDVVAHGVSLMVVQTEAALGVLRTRPDAAEESLAHAQRAGREAIVELQHLVQVLRHDDEGTGGHASPGLHQLDRLVDDTRRCGISVTVEDDTADDAGSHPGRAVPASVDVTAYRVVQEALTNVVRHSGAGHAVVRVASSDGRLVVEVSDDGTGTTGAASGPGRTGHGLVGLHERVALAGGRLEVGAGAAGSGFRVRAVLPLGTS